MPIENYYDYYSYYSNSTIVLIFERTNATIATNFGGIQNGAGSSKRLGILNSGIENQKI